MFLILVYMYAFANSLHVDHFYVTSKVIFLQSAMSSFQNGTRQSVMVFKEAACTDFLF